MADFTKPALTSTYTNFIAELKDRDNTISSLFSDGTTHTGTYPVRAVRWNSNGYFQRRNSNNNGWERLEGNSGTHKFVNLQTGALTATNGATITGGASATGQIQANNFNVTGTTKPANGFYLPASNEMRFTTNSNDRFTIESNGEVGINTVNPAQRLHVIGNVRIENGSSATLLELGEGGSGNRNCEIRLIGDNDNTGADCGLKIIRTSGGANASSELIHRGTGQFILSAIEGADMLFKTTNSTRMIIDSGGAVCVGSDTTPDDRFHVKHNVNAAAAIRLQNNDGYVRFITDSNDLFIDADVQEMRSRDGATDYLKVTSSLFDIKINAKVNGTLQSTGNVTAPTFVGDIDANNGDFNGTLEADAITVNGVALNTVIAGVTVTNATNAVNATSATNSSKLMNRSVWSDGDNFDIVPYVSSSGNLNIGYGIHFHIANGTADNSAADTAEIEFKTKSSKKAFYFGDDILPDSNGGYDLGHADHRWNNLYVNDLQLSNKGSTNDVDGTWGDWTLQEAEETVFMINNRNGKNTR